MSSATITAIAYLLAELTVTGASINSILRQVESTGVVPQDLWDAMKAERAKEVADWQARRSAE